MVAVLSPGMRNLLAFLVFVHGLIYLWGAAGLPDAIAGWQGSMLTGDFIGRAAVGGLIVGLHVLAGLFFIALSGAIAFAPGLHGAWRPVTAAAAIVGLTAFAVLWDGRLGALIEQGVVGAAISLLLLVAVLRLPERVIATA